MMTKSTIYNLNSKSIDYKCTRKCYLCKHTDFAKVMTVSPANFSQNIKEFDIFRCLHCGLSEMLPFPKQRDIHEIYVNENTFSKLYIDKNGHRTSVHPHKVNMFFNILEPLYRKYGADEYFVVKTCYNMVSQKNRILDIGCGTGNLLEIFDSIYPQMEVTGIDIDPEVKENAISSIKNNIIIGDFLTYKFKNSFDIIIMRFVLEHLLNFHDYIQKAVDLLNSGGILFISTPDFDSAKARQLNTNWESINSSYLKTGHVRWFNKSSIEYLANHYSLTLEKYVNRGELIFHLPKLLQNILRALCGTEKSGTHERFIKYYAPRMVYSILFDGILSTRLSYGENIYAFMKKRRSS